MTIATKAAVLLEPALGLSGLQPMSTVVEELRRDEGRE
jgi:hypothetical protein